jgi:hypothetical protein
MKEPFSDRFSIEPTWHNTLFHRMCENGTPGNSVSSSIHRNVITRLFRNLDVVNLNRAKHPPKGERWVRKNTNMEKCQFKSPHPNLLPEGEEGLLLGHQHCSRKLEARHD